MRLGLQLGLGTATAIVAAISGWLLATGFWNDAAPWNDSQNWID